MKKPLLLALLFICILIAGCDSAINPSPAETVTMTVTFDAQGGTPATTTMSVKSGSAIGTFPANPVKDGFVFSGWWTLQSGGGTQVTTSTVITENITVYAKWVISVQSFTVVFDSDGGSPSTSNVSAADGGTIGSFPAAPIKIGYNFGGWYTEKDGAGVQFNQSTVVTGNITLYAYWTSNAVYTVLFNSDGGTPDNFSIIVEEGKSASTLPAAPTKTNFYFAGWFTKKSGEGDEFLESTPVTNDIINSVSFLSSH